MPIQVAHIVPLAARIGGYERQALLLAAAQARSGQIVSIITHAPHARQLEGRTAGVNVHGVKWNLGRASSRAIDRALVGVNVAHVHAIDPFSAAVVLRARRRGIPAIIKIATHGDALRYADPSAYPPEVSERRLFEPWRLRRQQRLMREAWNVFRSSEKFVALSSAIEDELKKVGIPADRIVRLPNAVVVPNIPIEIRPEARRAIYVGRLEERKRVGDLLATLEMVRESQPDADLDIIGDGANRQSLQSRPSRAIFHGTIEDPHSMLRSADVFLFPSEREGCPNALLEAAAAGLPCIATRIPGITDWFDESMMVLVEPGRPDLIAREWLDLWNRAARRTSLGDAAREQVRRTAEVTVITQRYSAIQASITA